MWKKHSKNRICGASETSLVYNGETPMMVGTKNNSNLLLLVNI